MITEFLRKFPLVEPNDVDGVDYRETRMVESFFFPQHDDQRHFRDENCYLKNGLTFTDGEDWHDPIENISYQVNSDGFHGTDFVTGPALLCAGCSVTVGFGLSHEETWPHILAGWKDSSVNVVGGPGASIGKIVYMVFAHIDRFGWPGEIHVCLPDVHRGWVQVRRGSGDHEESAIWYDPDTSDYYTHSVDGSSFKVDSPDGTKRSPAMASIVRENMMALDMLSMVAWATGIPLVISTYADSTHKMLTNRGNVYPGYKPLHRSILDSNLYPVGHPTDCCDIEEGDFSVRSETWTYAADGRHPGMHSHVHLAEAHAGEKIR